jgi:uroporphyrinogen-III synthase
MTLPLAGRRVALAEGRQLEELADLLAREGATPLRYPLLSILDAPDPGPVVAWLRELAADRFAYVVFMTGEGVRRLLGFADRAGLRDAVLAALGEDARAGLDAALDSRVIHVVEGRIRSAHPLHRVAALSRVSPSTLRRLHARLAVTAADPEERVAAGQAA